MTQKFTFETAQEYINKNMALVIHYKSIIENNINNNQIYKVNIPENLTKKSNESNIQYSYFVDIGTKLSQSAYNRGATIELAKELHKIKINNKN